MAEVYKYTDWLEHGSEANLKAKGLYFQKVNLLWNKREKIISLKMVMLFYLNLTKAPVENEYFYLIIKIFIKVFLLMPLS